MLPQSHVALTWLTLSFAQERFDIASDADYRLVAVAALGSDLIDKPLAWAYFYNRFKSAVLFAHTLIAYVIVIWLGFLRFPEQRVYALAFVGHALCDRIWHFHDTFYWPLRGMRFQVWGKRGSEQEKIGLAYWYAFTRRPELWGWELAGLLALVWFVYRHRLYRTQNLIRFILTGRVTNCQLTSKV
ncbi:hypothetical protein KFU94_16040 [Chloroflexi bacterium TSY]|nr:hypothetical protein [Chloroflexi bacterium TSY]